MNNNPDFQFGMYEPATDSVIINTGENSILVISCKECNSYVIFNEPNDIVYLYRLYDNISSILFGLQFLLHLLQFIQQCWFSWISLLQFLN